MDGLDPPKGTLAVVGTGISGLATAWLLQQRYSITVYEQDDRVGGHTCTVNVGANSTPVDMGFIVYNESTYPNLTALFDYLDVPTQTTDMSLSISLDDGRLEYGGGRLRQLLAQKSNLLRPRFWSMLRDLVRFYKQAPADLADWDARGGSLGEYLRENSYGEAFIEDHLLPMAAAIWSVPPNKILEFPAAAFIRFKENHGLLKLANRPLWRTVKGGSREYVKAMVKEFSDRIKTGCGVRSIRRTPQGVAVTDIHGETRMFDQVVLACHADQTLTLLDDASPHERRLLGAFHYSSNTAILHGDPALMPVRRAAWASWNYAARSGTPGTQGLTVTYWMNLLQNIPGNTPYFVTLNPIKMPAPEKVFATQRFEHPVMDEAALRAQRDLWTLQGVNRTWFCGSYFGAGFHEDGLQSGLAVAEAISGIRRPWAVDNESGRIVLRPSNGATVTSSAVA